VLTSNFQFLVFLFFGGKSAVQPGTGYTALGGFGGWVVGSLKWLQLAGSFFASAAFVVLDTGLSCPTRLLGVMRLCPWRRLPSAPFARILSRIWWPDRVNLPVSAQRSCALVRIPSNGFATYRSSTITKCRDRAKLWSS